MLDLVENVRSVRKCQIYSKMSNMFENIRLITRQKSFIFLKSSRFFLLNMSNLFENARFIRRFKNDLKMSNMFKKLKCFQKKQLFIENVKSVRKFRFNAKMS